MLDIGAGRHVGRAARGQMADLLPILPSTVSIPFEPPDIAAFEQGHG